MIRGILFTCMFLFKAYICLGQLEQVWVFGRSKAGLNFNTSTPTAVQTSLTGFGEASASVCNINGDLLFYTEGSRVWDRFHNLMPNGSDLTGLPNIVIGSGQAPSTTSTAQGALIVPLPEQPNKYYIFSLSPNELEVNEGRLYYSVVDMGLNSGLGDIVTGQKGILLDTGLTEQMTAIIGDECNIWLIVCSQHQNGFKSFEINATGIQTSPVLSSVGWAGASQATGKILAAPNRKKMAATNTTNGTALFDFDPVTGLLSNAMPIHTGLDYGVCFSPDGDKLYISSLGGGISSPVKINQFDLSSWILPTIIASETYLGTLAIALSDLKSGPDNKIYFIYGDYTLGTIRAPNLAGAACQYTPISISLVPGTTVYGGLPNIVPHFKSEFLRTHTVIPCLTNTLLMALDTNGSNYLWNDNITGHSRDISGLGTYWVTYHKPPCTAITDTFKILSAFHPQVTLDITSSCLNIPNGSVRLVHHNMDTSQYFYSWRDMNDLLLSSGDSLINVSPGNYTLQISNAAGCDTTFFFTVPASYFGNRSLLQVSPSCKEATNGSARFILNPTDTNTYQFIWKQDNDTTILSLTDAVYGLWPANYNVHISTIGGCDTTIRFAVEEVDFKVSFDVDTLICLPDTIHLINNSDAHFTTYQWYFGDDITSNVLHPEHNYQTPGRYTVMLTGSGPICTDTAYKKITVDSIIGSLSFSADKKEICSGEKIQFYPNTDNTTTINLHWNLGDGNIYTTPVEHIQHAYDNDGNKVVILTARFRACPAKVFIDTIKVYPFPLVDLGPDSVICYKDIPVVLQNHQPHHKSYQYQWNTGETAPTITVLHHGIYTLTITGEHDCATTESVIVDKDCYLDIPNAFTPNGDGDNDYFIPRSLLSKGIVSFRIKILNRWGQLVFETNVLDGMGWDGRLNNREQPVGVYLYLMEITFKNGTRKKYEGNLTLIR